MKFLNGFVRGYQKYLVKREKQNRFDDLWETAGHLVQTTGEISYDRKRTLILMIAHNSQSMIRGNLSTFLSLHFLKDNDLSLSKEFFRKAARYYREEVGSCGLKSLSEDYLNASKEAMRNAKAVAYEISKGRI